MSNVSRNILPGQGDGFALLRLEDILTALRLNAALKFLFVRCSVSCLLSLRGLAGCVVAWLRHSGLLASGAVHAGRRLLGALS